jgi:hypothetical protein
MPGIKLERDGPPLFDLTFHLLARCRDARVTGIDAAAEQRARGKGFVEIVLGAYRCKPLLVNVVEHDGLRHRHVGRAFFEKHLAELRRGPAAGERLVRVSDPIGLVLPFGPLHFADLEMPSPVECTIGSFQIVVRQIVHVHDIVEHEHVTVEHSASPCWKLPMRRELLRRHQDT